MGEFVLQPSSDSRLSTATSMRPCWAITMPQLLPRVRLPSRGRRWGDRPRRLRLRQFESLRPRRSWRPTVDRCSRSSPRTRRSRAVGRCPTRDSGNLPESASTVRAGSVSGGAPPGRKRAGVAGAGLRGCGRRRSRAAPDARARGLDQTTGGLQPAAAVEPTIAGCTPASARRPGESRRVPVLSDDRGKRLQHAGVLEWKGSIRKRRPEAGRARGSALECLGKVGDGSGSSEKKGSVGEHSGARRSPWNTGTLGDTLSQRKDPGNTLATFADRPRTNQDGRCRKRP